MRSCGHELERKQGRVYGSVVREGRKECNFIIISTKQSKQTSNNNDGNLTENFLESGDTFKWPNFKSHERRIMDKVTCYRQDV